MAAHTVASAVGTDVAESAKSGLGYGIGGIIAGGALGAVVLGGIGFGVAALAGSLFTGAGASPVVWGAAVGKVTAVLGALGGAVGGGLGGGLLGMVSGIFKGSDKVSKDEANYAAVAKAVSQGVDGKGQDVNAVIDRTTNIAYNQGSRDAAVIYTNQLQQLQNYTQQLAGYAQQMEQQLASQAKAGPVAAGEDKPSPASAGDGKGFAGALPAHRKPHVDGKAAQEALKPIAERRVD